MIPVGYAPSSVVLDTADNALLVANDKGWGTTGNPSTCNPSGPANATIGGTFRRADHVQLLHRRIWCHRPRNPPGSWHRQHHSCARLRPRNWRTMTDQVFQNNHWDLEDNIFSAAGGNRHAKPLAIPERIGDPSKIKHVFLIIRENRTYDQSPGRCGQWQWRPNPGSLRRQRYSYYSDRPCHAQRARAGGALPAFR